MHTIKLKIQDSIFDKVIYFLKQLPNDKIEIIENTKILQRDNDFISYYCENPINTTEHFLSRDKANER